MLIKDRTQYRDFYLLWVLNIFKSPCFEPPHFLKVYIALIIFSYIIYYMHNTNFNICELSNPRQKGKTAILFVWGFFTIR